MRALVVLAHPEPRSFNAALKDASVEVLASFMKDFAARACVVSAP